VRLRTLATAALLLLIVSCGSSGGDASAIVGVNGVRVPAPQLVTAMAGLCTARTQAATQPDAAKATFFDNSHQAIHDIAAALERTDRSASSTLLVAKQKVEADLDATPPGSSLVADLDGLASVTHDSLDRLHIAAAPCPSSP
jgi:hypothetical protein